MKNILTSPPFWIWILQLLQSTVEDIDTCTSRESSKGKRAKERNRRKLNQVSSSSKQASKRSNKQHSSSAPTRSQARKYASTAVDCMGAIVWNCMILIFERDIRRVCKRLSELYEWGIVLIRGRIDWLIHSFIRSCGMNEWIEIKQNKLRSQSIGRDGMEEGRKGGSQKSAAHVCDVKIRWRCVCSKFNSPRFSMWSWWINLRHHFPLPLPAHCSLWWNLAWGLPIADGDVALPCLGATRLFFGGWETRRATAVIDSRVLFGTDSLVWYAGRLCNMQLRQKELGGGCGRLLFGWRWFWVLMMSLTLLLRLFDN